MRQSLFLTLLTIFTYSFGQEKEFYKNTILFGQGDLIKTEYYNGAKDEPLRETNGFSLGASTGLIATPNFQLDLKLGYRYIKDYAHPDAVGFSKSNPAADHVFFDYHGGWTGLGFNLGRRHLWESSLIIGGGLMKKPSFSLSLGELEMGLQTGYKYITPFGLVLRAGVYGNFARNTFFTKMYTGYVGLGYAFQKSQGVVTDKEQHPKQDPYFNINISGYIGNLTSDFVGVNLRFDHFLYNGYSVDLGYGVSTRVGLDFDEEINFSASASFIALFGKSSSKFEFSLGPNFPFEEINTNFLAWYEAIHLGLGYRFVPKEFPLTLRMGSATTSIIHFGVGYKF